MLAHGIHRDDVGVMQPGRRPGLAQEPAASADRPALLRARAP